MELWKFVKGYKSKYGRYRVSNLGRVKNGLGRVLSFRKQHKGYVWVRMIKDGISKNVLVHRMVANAFIPNPDNLPQVNHCDTDKKNNKVSNLQWCTNSHNSEHAVLNGLKNKSNLTHDQAKEIRDTPLSQNGFGVNSNNSVAILAIKYGVSVHVIRDIRRGKSFAR